MSFWHLEAAGLRKKSKAYCLIELKKNHCTSLGSCQYNQSLTLPGTWNSWLDSISEWGAKVPAPCNGDDITGWGRPVYITEITRFFKNSKVRETIKLSAWQSQPCCVPPVGGQWWCSPRWGPTGWGIHNEDGCVWINKLMVIAECYCLLNSSICANDISRLAPPRPIKIFTLLIFAGFFFFFLISAMIDGVPMKTHSTM